jgi:hypothetical protein
VPQRVEALSPDEIALVEKQRSWVRDHFDAGARHQYQTVEGKLRLLDTIIRSGRVEATGTWKLQSLGITFGDALCEKLELRWVAVDDEYGRDPALCDEGTALIIFPMTTISKRVEGGETVNVRGLFDQACQSIIDLRSKFHGE